MLQIFDTIGNAFEDAAMGISHAAFKATHPECWDRNNNCGTSNGSSANECECTDIITIEPNAESDAVVNAAMSDAAKFVQDLKKACADDPKVIQKIDSISAAIESLEKELSQLNAAKLQKELNTLHEEVVATVSSIANANAEPEPEVEVVENDSDTINMYDAIVNTPLGAKLFEHLKLADV